MRIGNDILRAIIGAELTVYMKHPLNNYCIYTDGKRIAYLQENSDGWRIYTVHIPNQQTGTGFFIDSGTGTPTREQLLSGFVDAPLWARWKDLVASRKYPSLAEFLKHNPHYKELIDE